MEATIVQHGAVFFINFQLEAKGPHDKVMIEEITRQAHTIRAALLVGEVVGSSKSGGPTSITFALGRTQAALQRKAESEAW